MKTNILEKDVLGEFGFYILWTKIEDAYAEFEVYEIIARDTLGKPFFQSKENLNDQVSLEDIKNAQTYLKGSIKWDSCSHFFFGDPDNSGYIHLCGAVYFKKHIALLEYLYKKAFVLMERDVMDDKERWYTLSTTFFIKILLRFVF
jgi:hypothetical protein